MVRVVCGRGGVIIECPFRTAQRWHCKKEDQQQQHNEILEKKDTRKRTIVCTLHSTLHKADCLSKKCLKKKRRIFVFFQLLWIEIDRRERGKKKNKQSYIIVIDPRPRKTHTHEIHARQSLSLPFTSPPTPDIEKNDILVFFLIGFEMKLSTRQKEEKKNEFSSWVDLLFSLKRNKRRKCFFFCVCFKAFFTLFCCLVKNTHTRGVGNIFSSVCVSGSDGWEGGGKNSVQNKFLFSSLSSLFWPFGSWRKINELSALYDR